MCKIGRFREFVRLRLRLIIRVAGASVVGNREGSSHFEKCSTARGEDRVILRTFFTHRATRQALPMTSTVFLSA